MSKAIKLIRSGDNQEYQIENLEKQSLKEVQVLVKNIASGINQDDVFINIPADKPYVIPGYSASGGTSLSFVFMSNCSCVFKFLLIFLFLVLKLILVEL